MSRSGYTDDEDEDILAHGRWRGRVASAIRGKRGQALLRELADALDAMPERRLAAGSLATAEGEFCTLGTIAAKHGIVPRSMPDEDWHHEEWEAIGTAINVAPVLIQEIVFENDEQVIAHHLPIIEKRAFSLKIFPSNVLPWPRPWPHFNGQGRNDAMKDRDRTSKVEKSSSCT